MHMNLLLASYFIRQPICIFLTNKEIGPDGSNCGEGYYEMDGECYDLDECMTFDQNNCMPGASCTNFAGGYSCPCADGYFALDFGCYDYDECSHGADDCSASGTICVNEPGGYSCHECPTGFYVDAAGNCGKMVL